MNISKIIQNRLLPYLVAILFSALLAACGSDGSDPEPGGSPTPPPPTTPSVTSTVTRTLTGTAATGAPVVGTVTIKDANGKIFTTLTDSNGTYSINLEGYPGPYLIEFLPDNNTLPVLYSYATNSGVANITQFTSLALFLAFQNLTDAFTNWTTTSSTWDRATLEDTLKQINANFSLELGMAGVDPTRYDLFTAPFDANNTGVDAFLDNFTVEINYTGNDYSITNNNSAGGSFTLATMDTAGYYIGMNATFDPVNTSVWQLTTTETNNGVESDPIIHTIPYTIDTLPWNKERFEELFWGQLPLPTSQTINCNDGTFVGTCEITINISQLETNYSITGTGEIGTTIESSAAFSWSVTSTIEGVVGGIPFSNSNTDSDSWAYTWVWERIAPTI